MIFVTVGTHEQPFNRLIQKVDPLLLVWWKPVTRRRKTIHRKLEEILPGL